MCICKDVRIIGYHRRSKHATVGYAGCNTPMVAVIHRSTVIQLHHVLKIKIDGVVPCMIIVWMKKGTEICLKWVTTEVVVVRSIIEECTKMF